MAAITPEFAREIFESQKEGLEYLEEYDNGKVKWPGPIQKEGLGMAPVKTETVRPPIDALSSKG